MYAAFLSNMHALCECVPACQAAVAPFFVDEPVADLHRDLGEVHY